MHFELHVETGDHHFASQHFLFSLSIADGTMSMEWCSVVDGGHARGLWETSARIELFQMVIYLFWIEVNLLLLSHSEGKDRRQAVSQA